METLLEDDNNGNDIEGSDFEDDLSDEDSEENEYKETLKREADKLKKKRMMSNRPSTIVQVSTGPLEIHLQSMKRQLKEHAALIEHPPFLDDLMEEVNKIAGLIRKIEHCQTDINNVRETLIDNNGSSSQRNNSESSDMSLSEKLTHLFKDLEHVRGVIRRIDVHNAVGANLIVKVRKLAKGLKELKAFSEKMYSNNMRVIQDELKGEIRSVNTRIQQLDDGHIEQFNEVIDRIKKAEDNIHEGQKEETERLSKKVEFMEENLTSDFYSFKEKVDVELESAKKTALQAYVSVSKESLGSGVQLVEKCMRKRLHCRLRARFRRWQNFDPYGDLRRGRNLIALVGKAHKKMFIRSALFEWKSYHEKQKARERMCAYLAGIIQKWRDIAFPSISRRFQTWKRFCVFMRFHIIERNALENASVEVATKKSSGELYCNDEFDELISIVNPKSDVDGSFQLTGLYIDRIYNKINNLKQALNQNSEATRLVGHRIEGVKNDFSVKLEERVMDVERKLKSQTNILNNKIWEIQRGHKGFEESIEKRLTATNDEVRRLGSDVHELAASVESQSSRLERLFSLHQKMLDRIDSIEKTQKSHESEMAKLHKKMTTISETNARNDAEIMLQKHMTESSFDKVREEIIDIKTDAKDCSTKLQAVLSNQSQNHSSLSNLTKDFKNKLSSFETWLNTTAPKPPSPNLLASLALKFEDRAVEKHSQDPANTFAVSMSTELAKDIATCSHWIVHHIVEATDVDVLTRIIKGSQDVTTVYDQTDPSNMLDNITSNEPYTTIKYSKSAKLTHEEFCVTTRESKLLRYLEKFQKILSQSREDVGLIRKEARSLFLRRFIDSLDLSLQKHDAIVLRTVSAMGRNQSENTGSAACMACDRPLKMRTTSRSVGELFDKFLLSGKKTSDVKREVMRQRIIESADHGPESRAYKYDVEEDKLATPQDYNGTGFDEDYAHEDAFASDHTHVERRGVIKLKPNSNLRPQSAPRTVHSRSVTELNIHLKSAGVPSSSPSKGGGFKGVKSASQEKLAANIANDIPLENSIKPRHAVNNFPSSSRKLLGKFENVEE